MSTATIHSTDEMSSGALAVFCKSATAAFFEGALERLGRAGTLKVGGPADAVAWCAENEAPSIMLVDIDTTAHPIPALVELAAVTGPGCRLVAMGAKQDVDLYRKLLKAGIFDYLVVPPNFAQLADVLSRADSDTWLGQPQISSVRVGQTLAVIGATGGVGASCLVTAMGQQLANNYKIPTVLVDYDRRGSDLALLLGLEANSGLAGILAAPEVDYRLIQRTLLTQENAAGEKQRLHLLTQRPGEESPVDPDLVLQLGGALCELFSMSIWDIPSHRPSGSDVILEQADVRIVVTDYSLQNARATHMLLSDFGDESHGQRLILVANATRSAEKPAFSRAQLEDFLGRQINMEIPYVGTALDSSLLEGQLNFAKCPPFRDAVDKLVCEILGRPVAKVEPEGIFRSLLKKVGLQ